MFIFWDENSPKTSLMICISVVLVVVLLWYISKQNYNTSCDRKIMDMHYQAHIKGYPETDLSKRGDTLLERHRKTLDPEKNVMDEHTMGDPLHDNVKKIDDPLSLDGLLQRQDETSDQQLQRSIDENVDGEQLEGMLPPIEAFEEDSLLRQMSQKKSVYS
jgi:hypothetical protein